MNKVVVFAVVVTVMGLAYGEVSESSVERDGLGECDFTKQELENAQKTVADLIGDDLKALAAGEKTRLDVAKAIERKAWSDKNAKAVKFLLSKGIFKLYAEAGDLENARRTLAKLHWQKCPSEMLRDIMREVNVDYGVRCSDTNCPLILLSFIHANFGLCGYSGEKLSDLKSVKFGSSAFAKGAKLTHSYEHNPLRTWEQSDVHVYKKTTYLQLPDAGDMKVELYYTKQSRRLFRVAFMAGYGSKVERRTAVGAMTALSKMINDAWGIVLYTKDVGSEDPDVSIAKEHEQIVEEYCRNGDVQGWTCCVTGALSDYGISDFRGDGSLSEDIHNCKHFHMSVLSESNLALAWKESGVDPYMAKCIGRAGQYADTVSYLKRMSEYGADLKSLGLLGRAYELGCYGTETNRELSISYYAKAYLAGNKEAAARLKSLGKDPENYVKAEREKMASERKKADIDDTLRDIQGLKKALDFAEALANAEKICRDSASLLDSLKESESFTNNFQDIENLLAGLETNDAAAVRSSVQSQQNFKLVKIKDSRDVEHEWKYAERGDGVIIVGLADKDAGSHDDGVRRIELPAVIGGKKVVAIAKNAFQYYHSLRKAILPEDLIEIGSSAFYACGELRDVMLPGGLKVIGDQSFGGCDELEEIEFPASLEKIGHNAFSRTALNKVTIPENVSEIGWGAFGDCRQLTTADIGTGLKCVDQRMFAGCTRLQEVRIPFSVCEIKSSAFEKCERLEQIVIDPKNVNFSVLDGLLLNKDGSKVIRCFGKKQEVVLPQSIVAIDDNAFSGRTGMKKISFPKTLLRIGSDAFYGCESLEEVEIPEGVEKISRHAFRNCRALRFINVAKENEFYASRDGVLLDKSCKRVMCCPGGKDSVVLPTTITDIDARAFEGCSKLRSISIPEGVTKLQISLFSDCENLETITIPKSVTKIDGVVFDGCKRLKTVLFLGNAPETRSFLGGCIYSWDACEVTTYVTKESTGWDVEIPGKWQQRPIVYREAMPNDLK